MSAAPSIEMFFQKQRLFIMNENDASSFQNECINIVVGRRNRIRSQAPIFALYPRRILSPPINARSPQKGTKKPAIGTPILSACFIICGQKCSNGLTIKIRANSALPSMNTYFIKSPSKFLLYKLDDFV